MAVAVGPGPELFQYPGELSDRRVGEAVADRLRPRTLLLGVPRVPIEIVLDAGERGLLLIGELVFGRRIKRCYRHVQVDTDAVRGILYSNAGGNDRPPVAALRGISLVAKAGHQLGPCARDALDIPALASWLVGETEAGKSRANEVKRVGRIAAMSGWIRERLDYFLELDDRPR